MRMESTMASSRLEAFPIGLHILVVDDDLTWLKILEKMLKKCSYEVTTCCLASVALELLHERRERFDIVISDVNMPDMDGFELLEHVGLDMDLPVIMMSVDGETSRVMKGVQHGACDYLLKPIRMKELRNIWQHVYRKRIHEIKEIEGYDICEEVQILRNAAADFDDRQLFCGAEFNVPRKRKDMDSKEASDQELSDTASVKKARVVWSVDLHQKFVNAVNQIGFDKVGPKKILDLMSVPGLTRENVASHLQKYRLYLSRLQKKNEGKGSDENTQTYFNPQELQGSFGIQNSPRIHQNTEASRYVPITQNNCNDPTEAITTGKDKTGVTQMKSDFTYYRSRHSSKTISPVSYTIDSVSQDFGARYEANVSTSKKNGTDLASMPEDLQLCSLRNLGCFEHVGLNGRDFFQYNDSTPLTEFGTNWYDGLEVNCEYLCDSVDYPIIDDCLFA